MQGFVFNERAHLSGGTEVVTWPPHLCHAGSFLFQGRLKAEGRTWLLFTAPTEVNTGSTKCSYVSFPSVCAALLTVLKRGKVKKGKNDLIGAEEGEDPFADISSVGNQFFLTHLHQQESSDLYVLSTHEDDLYNKKLNMSTDSLTSYYQIRMSCHCSIKT